MRYSLFTIHLVFQELSIKPHATSPTTLNLGLVGASSTSGATVSLQNPNPAAVCLRRSGVDMAGAVVRLLGCEHHHADQNLTACVSRMLAPVNILVSSILDL